VAADGYSRLGAATIYGPLKTICKDEIPFVQEQKQKGKIFSQKNISAI
jgi:hypothetical protein